MSNTPTITDGERTFRDLNKNGTLDPYEDSRRPIDERVEDLLSQMTLEEKAGLMFHAIAEAARDGSLDGELLFSQTSITEMITEQLMNHFNVHALPEPRLAAMWHNRVQELAENTRLGIPVTISSDPRHSFSHNPAVGLSSGGFSQWPEQTGLGAADDAELVEAFGDIARQEYTAVGIRVTLHPMADLATEPRWPRSNGTFGEDAALSSKLIKAYIRGFQGAALGPESVACMTKHFPGGGPQKDGEDPHFSYGKEQIYPGNNFDYHLRPFEAAFEAGTAQIMPYYGVPIGIGFEEVAFGFNKDVITGLLRGRYGFDGVVCTDWGLLTPHDVRGREMKARAWGVEHLTPHERAKKALDAGVDQFGGEQSPDLIVELVRSGQVPESRIDESARRILRDKFRLGLFDNPYVDPDKAAQVVGSERFRAAGETAQRKSIVLLKNGMTAGKPMLPLTGQPKIYIMNMAADVASRYGQVVEDIAEADVAILRLQAPYEPRDNEPLESFFHAGRLAFTDQELAPILEIMNKVPTVVDIYLDRPAVLPEIAARSAALLANFGASDAAVLDILFGRFNPAARLPFELPASMEAVQRQKPDVPYDSENPLFPFGYGLSYENV